MRLDPDACRERLAAARSAVLATTGADRQPHLVPMTFALVPAARPPRGAAARAAEEIVSVVDHKPKTTTALRRLRNITENPRVAVLADRYDDDWSRLWWVRADGVASVVVPGGHGQQVWERAVEALTARYPQYRAQPPQGPVIRVVVERWSGWAYAG